MDKEKRFDEAIRYPLKPEEWEGRGVELLGAREVAVFRHVPTGDYLIQTRNGERVQHMRLSPEALGSVLEMAYLLEEGDPSKIRAAMQDNTVGVATAPRLHAENPRATVINMAVVTLHPEDREPAAAEGGDFEEDATGVRPRG